MPHPSTPPGTATSPVLDMDWDDEELSTQVYDKPEEQGEEAALYDEFPSVGPGYEDAQAYTSGQAAVATYVPPPGEPMPGFASSYSSVPSAALPGTPSQARALQATQPVLAHAPVEKSKSQFYALAVGALILVSFLGYIFLSKTEPGVVQLTTQPPDATVLFDHKPVGSSSPFLVTGVLPGEKHVLEVSKDGYRTWSQEVQVQAGQTLQFPVTLQPDGNAEEQPSEQAVAGAPGSFTLESSPQGARVFLEGQELNGVTPLRVSNLPPKTYALKLQLPDFREHTLSVDIKPGQEVPLARVALVPEQLHVRVSSEPSNAEVSVVRGDERRSLGTTPVDVTLENEDTPWLVEVQKSGFMAFSQSLVAESGRRDVFVRANLTRIAGGGGRSAAGGHSGGGTGGVAASPGGNGTLRINSRPWSQVVIDGRAIGNTPQMNVPLPEGTHKVTLINPEFDIKKTITVRIRAGQVETQIVALQ